MTTLTRDELVAIFRNPEQASLRVSPQILVEFLDGYWVRPDGKHVRMTEVQQLPDGELLPVLSVVEPVPA